MDETIKENDFHEEPQRRGWPGRSPALPACFDFHGEGRRRGEKIAADNYSLGFYTTPSEMTDI